MNFNKNKGDAMKKIIVMLNGVSGDNYKHFINLGSSSSSNSNKQNNNSDEDEYEWALVIGVIILIAILKLISVFE